ncbi:MAG: serine/threonine protein kinase [Planctomycetota bacterium]
MSLNSGRQRNENVSEKPQKSTASGQNRVQQLGDFELKKKLGKGGMGEVFLARQISLDRMVALKTLSKELSKKADFVARFEREAKSMARIDHPNVVKIYAVDSFKGIHFAAIEYIDGQSVQRWLDQRGHFSVADALHVAIVCLEALKHAHAENMVHRDIKPDNILITRKGVVKVADFGLAKAMDEDVSMTQSGTGLGTPLYMAPEQARNAKHVDHRVDIYALGATLYHMLTGKLPFTGSTALELIMAKERGTYPTARSIRAEVPERLDLVIDKLMARDPNHRYRSCDEAIRDLAALALHSETLSFIEGAEALGSGRGGPSTLTAGAGTQQIRRTVGATQGIAGDTASTTTRIWYVQFEDAKGKTVVEKHSTGRILKMLAAGQLTAKTRAKFSADGAYLPLAQFPEFSKAVEDSLARKSAAIRKEDMASLYKKVEKEQKMFYLKRKVKDMFRSAVGISSLLLLLGGIGLVVYLLAQYGSNIPPWVAEKIGLTGQTETKEKPRNPIDPLAPPVENTNAPAAGSL